MNDSDATTRGVRVHVRSQYVPQESDPDEGRWFFVYTVRVTNTGDEVVQLVSRRWVISDGNGRIEEVEGPGVVGAQPTLNPGEGFEYTSFCPLPTPVGSMKGTYQMVSHSTGDRFDAVVAPFTLSEPYAFN